MEKGSRMPFRNPLVFSTQAENRLERATYTNRSGEKSCGVELGDIPEFVVTARNQIVHRKRLQFA